MLKVPPGKILEPGCRAIAVFPTKLFDQMDDFMLENSLHGLQAIGAGESANGDWTIGLAEATKKKTARDADFIMDFPISHSKSSRLTPGTSHASRQVEAQRSAVQCAVKQAAKTLFVIGPKQEFQIAWMDQGEVALANQGRV
jgi:hypothetical protein